jgi:hypothetical protein
MLEEVRKARDGIAPKEESYNEKEYDLNILFFPSLIFDNHSTRGLQVALATTSKVKTTPPHLN